VTPLGYKRLLPVLVEAIFRCPDSSDRTDRGPGRLERDAIRHREANYLELSVGAHGIELAGHFGSRPQSAQAWVLLEATTWTRHWTG